ncbi:hypothetical protein, partial [Sphingobium sp. AP50]|uniref:hypothetical protein n=1 Tax=Sphingobium sp. AP50 TaxID=1884369 RepID=UPI003527E861
PTTLVRASGRARQPSQACRIKVVPQSNRCTHGNALQPAPIDSDIHRFGNPQRESGSLEVGITQKLEPPANPVRFNPSPQVPLIESNKRLLAPFTLNDSRATKSRHYENRRPLAAHTPFSEDRAGLTCRHHGYLAHSFLHKGPFPQTPI